ncbi:unnamed protein product, partial [Scytosiphon promiscuus]
MGRLLILFFTFLLSTTAVFANFELDSLTAQLERAKGLDRVDILNQISILYFNTNSERALHFANEALRYAKEETDKKRLAQSYLNVGIVRRNIGQSEEALNLFNEVLKLAEEVNDPALKADVLHKTGVTYLLVNDFNTALDYAEKELLIWREIKNTSGLGDALNLIGIIYINLEKLDKAREN